MGLLLYFFVCLRIESLCYALPTLNTPPNSAPTLSLTGLTNAHNIGQADAHGTGQTGIYTNTTAPSSTAKSSYYSEPDKINKSHVKSVLLTTRYPPSVVFPSTAATSIYPSTSEIPTSTASNTAMSSSGITSPNPLATAAAESLLPFQVSEFNSAPSNAIITVSGSTILLQKQTLPGFAGLTRATTITTSIPTATASGGIAYANGPIVLGPQGVVWGVSNGNEGGSARGGGAIEGTNQGESSVGSEFLGLMGFGGQGLGKEGLGGSPAGAII